MTRHDEFTVKLIAATRHIPEATNGLITFEILVARGIWTEVLTHRRTARNASSRRAMSGKRIIDTHGHWTPKTFHYGVEKGMGDNGVELPPEHQDEAFFIWERAIRNLEAEIQKLAALGVTKDEYNRLLTDSHMTAGIVTATESGWNYFLSLRRADPATRPMRDDLALKIEQQIADVTWNISKYHFPYRLPDEPYTRETGLLCSARMARVTNGTAEARGNDLSLAGKLEKDKHASPFEHCCEAVENAPLSALNCVPSDKYEGMAWRMFRDELGLSANE